MQPELRAWDREGGLDHPDPPGLPTVDQHGATGELLVEGDLTTGTDLPDHGDGPDHDELDSSDQQLKRCRVDIIREAIAYDLDDIENLRCGVLWSLGYKYTLFRFLADLDDANERAEELMRMIHLEKKHDTIYPEFFKETWQQNSIDYFFDMYG